MSADDLLADLLEELRAEGVDLLPWSEVEELVVDRPHLLAVVYPPGDAIPAQVMLRPVDTQLAIVVAREVQLRLRRFGEDPEAFMSYDPVHDRPVALIYDLTKS